MLRPYLVISDHLGSTSTTANADGMLHSVIQYTAFGEIRSTQGNTPTQYRYTGQLAQAELGLDYYIARFYDPLTGHFTQADTLIPEPGKASAFDRYAYALNNPIRYNDPSGHGIDCGIGDPDCDRSGDFKRGREYNQQKNKKKLSQTPTTLPIPTPFFSRTPTPIPPPMSTPTPYGRSTSGSIYTATTTSTASLTTDMDGLQIQFWFHKTLVKDTLDIIEIIDILFEKSN